MCFRHAWVVVVCVSVAAITPLLLVGDQLHYLVLTPAEIEQRLRNYKGNDNQREINLKTMFENAGCSKEQLSEQLVKTLKQPNIICTLPGETDSTIVVGAHFDHVEMGDGVIDNWSGASLLPSLFQSLKSDTRHHTFVFISFSGEEKGLIGSQFYVSNLSAGSLARIKAMVNMDTLGLGPTAVWVSRSDKDLVQALNTMAYLSKLPLKGVNVEKVGKSDEEPFIQHHIPAVIIHSLTQETLRVLHSPLDNYKAVRFDDYYNTYRLLSAYLAFLDDKLSTTAVNEISPK
jgi:putative aminopeptidase FrvX